MPIIEFTLGRFGVLVLSPPSSLQGGTRRDHTRLRFFLPSLYTRGYFFLSHNGLTGQTAL